MSFKEKFLNKSKSYIYYKNSHVSLTNENKKLHNQLSYKDDEINKLKNQLQNMDDKIHELENQLIHNEKGFIFSIIIAIFNSEDYLSEAIDSILNQTFPKEKIQIILINDGSTDKCEEICYKYLKKYPNNFVYQYQKNQGQSVARNNGLKIAKGKFINFLDSDDKLELNTLEEVYYHFIKFGDEIDIISIPRYLFGAHKGYMGFSEKYKPNRIINIKKEFDFPQVSISATFIRKEAFIENFNTKLIISEDALLLNKIILNKCKFGVIGNVKYLYRKRFESNSTIDTKKTKKEYFSMRMEIYFKDLINFAIDKYGYVPKYIQSVLIYDLRWLFEQKTEINILSNEEAKEYHTHIFDVIQYIDDDIIYLQNFDDSLKKHMINFKRGIEKFNYE